MEILFKLPLSLGIQSRPGPEWSACLHGDNTDQRAILSQQSRGLCKRGGITPLTSHTHTHTHTYTHTHTHRRTRTQTYKHTHIHTCQPVESHSMTHTHTHVSLSVSGTRESH